jgi:acid phosphatase (class A)
MTYKLPMTVWKNSHKTHDRHRASLHSNIIIYSKEENMTLRTITVGVTSFLILSLLTMVSPQWASGEEAYKPPERVPGYLAKGDVPDSLALIPAPPAPGSPAFILDEQVNKKALTMKGTSAWDLAERDADIAFPHVVTAFSCSLNVPITEKDTPRLYKLMRRTFVDATMATFAAKDKYARPRPFMVNKQPTCSPGEETRLLTSGSYPSGHAALGWAWALILSEISPENANAILIRGRAYGQGRTVCNVHWQSDINEGMVMAAAAVARLHGNGEFIADVEAAKKEVADVRNKGLKPMENCKLETTADTVKATQLP